MENEKQAGESGNISPYHPKFRWKIDSKKCTLCGECIEACSIGLLEEKDEMIIINNERGCTQCGDCAAACGHYAIVLT